MQHEYTKLHSAVALTMVLGEILKSVPTEDLHGARVGGAQ
jgi:hypothetical protein